MASQDLENELKSQKSTSRPLSSQMYVSSGGKEPSDADYEWSGDNGVRLGNWTVSGEEDTVRLLLRLGQPSTGPCLFVKLCL